MAAADCFIGWWLILFFNLLEVLQSQVISPCTPAAERLPFPHIRAVFLLIETHSAATALSQGGKWQVKIPRRPLPCLPPRAKVAVKLISSFRDPGAGPAKTLHFMRASKGWCRVTSWIVCVCRCVYEGLCVYPISPGPNVCTPLWLNYAGAFYGEKWWWTISLSAYGRTYTLWESRWWPDSICIRLPLSRPVTQFMSWSPPLQDERTLLPKRQ